MTKSLVASCRQFDSESYRTPTRTALFTVNMIDEAAYRRAVASFLTELGPDNIIGITSSGFANHPQVVGVWYWSRE